MKVICTKCRKDYDFSAKWFKRNNPEVFICRICKIKKTTQSENFRKTASDRSKEVLSDENIKNRMSQIATLNNLRNSDKISQSLKEHFSNDGNKQKVKDSVKRKWQDPEYAKSVSDGIKKKWKEPDYRGKVLGSRANIRKKSSNLTKKLDDLNLLYEKNFCVGIYEFELLINGIYLYDNHLNLEKKLFIEHYFSKFKYINDLAEVETLES